MTKGQVQLGTLALVGVISFGASWLGNYVLNSPQQLSSAVASTQSDIKVIQTQQLNQDNEIITITQNLKILNDNVVKLLVANHISPATQ